MTVREQIISNLSNGLQNISVANGYVNTITEVRKGIVNSATLNSFPVLTVQPASEVLQSQIEGQQEGINTVDVFIIGYTNSNDITASVESLIRDLKLYFYRDVNLSANVVCTLFDIDYIQGYEIKEINPYLAYTNNICSFGVLLKIEYVDFVEPANSIVLSAPVLSSPANNFTTGSLFQSLNWNSVTNAQYYHIRVYDNLGNLSIDQDNLVNTSFTIPDDITFNNNDVITWKVRAKAAQVSSEWSDTWTYTINDASITPLTPAQISNNILWLRSDAGVTTVTGNKVSQWSDQSGQNNHLIQNTDVNRPVLTANVVGSHSAIYHNPTADRKSLGYNDTTKKFEILANSTKSILITVQPDSTYSYGNNAIGLVARSNANFGDNWILGKYNDNINSIRGVLQFPRFNTNIVAAAPLVGSLTQILIVCNNSVVSIYLDGVKVSQNTVTTLTSTFSNELSTYLTLGSEYHTASNSIHYKGYTFEMAFWNKALSSTEIAGLYKYHTNFYNP